MQLPYLRRNELYSRRTWGLSGPSPDSQGPHQAFLLGVFAGLSSNLPEPHTTPLLVPTERLLGGTLASRCTRSTYRDSSFLDSGTHQRVRRVGVRGCHRAASSSFVVSRGPLSQGPAGKQPLGKRFHRETPHRSSRAASQGPGRINLKGCRSERGSTVGRPCVEKDRRLRMPQKFEAPGLSPQPSHLFPGALTPRPQVVPHEGSLPRVSRETEIATHQRNPSEYPGKFTAARVRSSNSHPNLRGPGFPGFRRLEVLEAAKSADPR